MDSLRYTEYLQKRVKVTLKVETAQPVYGILLLEDNLDIQLEFEDGRTVKVTKSEIALLGDAGRG